MLSDHTIPVLNLGYEQDTSVKFDDRNCQSSPASDMKHGNLHLSWFITLLLSVRVELSVEVRDCKSGYSSLQRKPSDSGSRAGGLRRVRSVLNGMSEKDYFGRKADGNLTVLKD